MFSCRSSSSGGFGLGLGGGLLLGYSLGRASGGYGGYGYGHNYGQYSRSRGYSTERWAGRDDRILNTLILDKLARDNLADCVRVHNQ